jgi:hypothetical protein
MSLTLVLILASGASTVKHGTTEQCETWYPGDWNKQIACDVIILTPEQKARLEEIRRVCDELSATAKSRGFVLTNVTFKDGDGESVCKEWDKARSSRRRDAH